MEEGQKINLTGGLSNTGFSPDFHRKAVKKPGVLVQPGTGRNSAMAVSCSTGRIGTVRDRLPDVFRKQTAFTIICADDKMHISFTDNVHA
jgi:hypothetical protein